MKTKSILLALAVCGFFARIAIAGLSAAVAEGQSVRQDEGRPNVVLMFIDDRGYVLVVSGRGHELGG